MGGGIEGGIEVLYKDISVMTCINNRFSQFLLVAAILGVIKIGAPQVTYVDVFKATPAAYTVVEKLLQKERNDQ